VTEGDRHLDLVALRLVAETYAMAVDRGDGPLFAAQFTADGVLEAPRGTFEGQRALEGVPAMMKRLYDRTFHAVVALVPVFDGDTAEAQTYTLARHFYRAASDGQEYCYEMTVRYEDSFRRTDAGWRLARRRLVLVGDSTMPTGRRDPASSTQGTAHAE
jgi:hypothetical protein